MGYRNLAAGIATLIFVFALFQMPAHAWGRSHVIPFATLPQGSAHPEGITADSKGNFYVVSWDYDHPGQLGHLIVFSPEGKFIRRVEVVGSSNLLCEIRLHPETSNLSVYDFGG